MSAQNIKKKTFEISIVIISENIPNKAYVVSIGKIVNWESMQEWYKCIGVSAADTDIPWLQKPQETGVKVL